MSSKPTNHIVKIEFLRALAAVAVVIFHFSTAPYAGFALVKSNFFKSVLEFGAQGVELFYIISGFVITYALSGQNYNLNNYFKFILKRISRIFPPYVITIFGILLSNYLLARFIWYNDFNLNWKEIVVNLFYLADLFPDIDWLNPIFATLKVEFQFYIIIGLLFPFIHKNKWALGGVTILFLILGVYWGSFDTVFRNSPYFFSGILIFYLTIKSNVKFNLLLLSIILGVLLIYYPYQDFSITLFGILVLYFLPSNFNLLKLTGKISYSFYLTHGIFGGWLIYFLLKFNWFLNHKLIAFLLAFLISWLCAWIMYQIIEKPSIKLSKSIKYK